MRKDRLVIYALFCLVLVINGLFLYSIREIEASWLNVPPVPSDQAASQMALGDKQLAYRANGLLLQTLGAGGGKWVALSDYNYDRLGQWFLLQHNLDPVSNFTPYLAAYVFGATSADEDTAPLVDYLRVAGNSSEGIKWHWLAQAVHMARYRLQDQDLALELAHQLAALRNPNLPHWARQMPAFIMSDRGEKEAAFEMMVSMLQSDAEHMQQAEINFIRYYICERILSPEEAAALELCELGY